MRREYITPKAEIIEVHIDPTMLVQTSFRYGNSNASVQDKEIVAESDDYRTGLWNQ